MLGQLTPEALATMLQEGETLFVEHKSDIAKGEGKTLSVTVASLANSLGGWVLIGVRNNGAVDPDWEPPAGELVDTVRQRLEANIDPMPSFAARVMETADGHRVGVVRVYESADTPHLVEGTVYVREPAKNKKNSAQPPYEPTPVRSHYELSQLVGRGADARADAHRRIAAADSGNVAVRGPLLRPIRGARGQPTTTTPSRTPGVALTLAPMTMTEPWRSWQVTEQAAGAIGRLADRVTQWSPRSDDLGATLVVPRPGGVAAFSQTQTGYPWTNDAMVAAHHLGYATTDRIGYLQVRLHLVLEQRGGRVEYHRSFETGDEIADLVKHVLVSASDTLAENELLGRYAAHMTIAHPAELYTLGPGAQSLPEPTNYDGEVTVDGPTSPEDPDVDALASRWRDELCRATGLQVWT